MIRCDVYDSQTIVVANNRKGRLERCRIEVETLD